MNEYTLRVLKNKVMRSIFFVIIQNPGSCVTDLIKLTNKKQSYISKEINNLEKAKLVKYKIIEQPRLKKIYYPSLRPFFEDIAKNMNADLTQEDYDAIDDFLLDKRVFDFVYDKSKDQILSEGILLAKAFTMLFSEEFKTIVEKDPDLKKKFDKFVAASMKIFEKFKIS